MLVKSFERKYLHFNNKLAVPNGQTGHDKLHKIRSILQGERKVL